MYVCMYVCMYVYVQKKIHGVDFTKLNFDRSLQEQSLDKFSS
jgi:hypothetical protein